MPETSGSRKGSLIVVGTGIRIVGQLTMEAIAWMKKADRLLYIVADPVSIETIEHLNPRNAESLAAFYGEGKPRMTTYLEMVERVLTCVRSGMLTCLASYGHPGVLAYPCHEAIRRVRIEGYEARMLPGISAEDCLFADLGVDPATHGCQTYEATDFLLHSRTIDPTSALVLWQVGLVGDPLFRQGGYDNSALPLLVGRLCRFYPPDHICYLYQAAVYPGSEPLVRASPIAALPHSSLTAMTTLYVPPSRAPVLDPTFADRLNAMTDAGGRPGPVR
ncbi:MAG: SAM-dependent methyltransferase [Isosphaeraceae bacterium]